ncbi:MAG TPA: DNA primase [Burkholderiales bacterium]|nr:DNA primase [Burkholderiales bacterium]
MIPDSFKQDLLNRVDIVDVVSRYVQLKKGGANFQGLCPFHSEKSPSFTVSPAKQFYHCFGCGAHGNAIGFLMAYAGLGYVDAIKDLASAVGMQVPEARPRSKEEIARAEREPDLYAIMEKAMEFYRAQLKKSPRAIDYLKGRGLTGEIAARFRIGYAPDGWQGLKEAFEKYEDKSLVECGLVIEGDEGKRYDRFRDRVMFPILSNRGQVIGFGGRVMGEGEPKYLNSPETPLFEKGRELYGLVQARDAMRVAGRVLVVEGYMDVVALAQFDVGYAVATLGTATTPVHVQKLLRLTDELVFSFDGDAAGRKAAWRALEVSLPLALDHKPIRFLFLPQGDDPDTYIRKHGKENFERLAREAPTLSEFLLAELRAQADLGSAEGRSGFLAAAKPHVQKVTAAALKLQLLKEVAKLGGVTQEEAESLFDVRPAQTYRRPAPERRSFSAPSSTEWKLLASIAVWPAIAGEVDLGVLDTELPESLALQEVVAWCRSSGGPVSNPMLIEHFRDSPHGELLFSAQAFGLDLGESEEEAREFLKHTLWKLEIQRKNKEIQDLGDRLRKGQLSREEHQHYGRMLSEVKALERRLQVEGRNAR